jgi:hypothetical protein
MQNAFQTIRVKQGVLFSAEDVIELLFLHGDGARAARSPREKLPTLRTMSSEATGQGLKLFRGLLFLG